MLIELYIENNGLIYEPVVIGPISWTSERGGATGGLSFEVLKDSKLNVTEGNKVTLKVDEQGIFKGFLFTKSRDKKQIINISAYDQFRYLQNKDTRKNPVRTASELIKTIAVEHGSELGEIDDTVEKLESKIESETSYIDMIMNDIVATTEKTGVDYAFYDDFGKLTLKNYEKMKVDYTISVDNIENFSYSSSINEDTYNQIIIANINEEDVVVHKKVYDDVNIKKWGRLQYITKLEDGKNPETVANELLRKYNKKTRKLSITRAFGNKNVRAGSVIKVNLPLGDIALNCEMIVDKCTHSFTADKHFMNLTLVSVED